METLFRSLNQRKRPEDIADIIYSAYGDHFSPAERMVLYQAAQHSSNRSPRWSSMPDEFEEACGLRPQADRTLDLFSTAYPLTDDECRDPAKMEEYITRLGHEIGKEFNRSDFFCDRLLPLTWQQREAIGGISRRKYNRMFRHLRRMEDKLRTLKHECVKAKFAKVSKSGLAHTITREDFFADPYTAFFVAYLTARRNMRSVFTCGKQARAYDEIADVLYQRCRTQRTTNWYAIAQVLPKQEVITSLSDTQKGELVGRWYLLMEDAATFLRATLEATDIDRETMIVRRGNDSTAWNLAAGAFNKARDGWIATLHGGRMGALLLAICPGKCLRLMAADVVSWHRTTGGDLDPDTAVWVDLPAPWEAISGESECTLAAVEDACRKHGVNPETSGWGAPRSYTAIANFRPTPELVHGVAIATPTLARIVRRARWFGGHGHTPRPLEGKQVPTVIRDEDGFALHVE